MHRSFEDEARRPSEPEPPDRRAEDAPPSLGSQQVLQLQRSMGNRAVSAMLARSRAPELHASGTRAIQRIRSNYAISLPGDEAWRLRALKPDDAYPQHEVDKFVDGLTREQMRFFESSMTALLDSNAWPKANVPNPFGGIAPITMWQCPNCRQPTTYQGIDRGHDTNWKPELKKAGVKNLDEAILVYNNLNNLRIECRACNASHAFERDETGHFTDLPAADDFPSGKAGKARLEALKESYAGHDMDEYDLSDDMIDDSAKEDTTLVTRAPITLSQDEGAINSGVSQTFWGGATVRLTGKTYRNQWVQVEVIESKDPALADRTIAWGTVKHLKRGDVTAF